MIDPKADALSKFADWYLRGNCNGILNRIKPPAVQPMLIDGIAGITLYQKDQFQVEMFVCQPNVIIPEHIHPNVDSFEVCLYGMSFEHELTHICNPNDSLKMYDTLRVRPEHRHSASSGPIGGVFISIQHWLNGVAPYRIAKDYEGGIIGTKHKELMND